MSALYLPINDRHAYHTGRPAGIECRLTAAGVWISADRVLCRAREMTGHCDWQRERFQDVSSESLQWIRPRTCLQ